MFFCLFSAQEQHQHREEVDQGGERGSVGRAEVVRDEDASGVQVQEGEVETGDGKGRHAETSERGSIVAA